MLIPIYNLNDEKEYKMFIERINNNTFANTDDLPRNMLLNIDLIELEKKRTECELKTN